ncbi:MAG TPA: DUF2490 domain-containing protein [Candidatus Omnitrophota bacterium]|nr:DUF2490 domain-containing protein [Candidatus Omnitrophota bacterium]
MKKSISAKILIKFFFTGLAYFLASGVAEAYEDGDFQYWNVNEIEWKAAKDWKLSLEDELRWGGGASQLYYQHYDLSVSYLGIAKWFEIKAGYRQIFNKGKKSWMYENVGKLDGTLKFDLFGFKLSDRSRLEYRDIEDKKDNWRYRNFFKAKIPMNIGKLQFAPYAGDELYFDLSRHFEFNRNRLYSGLEFTLFGGLTLDLHYILQTSKGKDVWTDYNILGTKLKFSF